MLEKSKIIESLTNLPEKVSLDDVIDRIIFLDKIENGIKQSKKGQITPDHQLDEKLPGWLK